MTTTYEFLSDSKCPYSKLSHRPRSDKRPGQLLVFNEADGVLSFIDGEHNVAAAGNVFLATPDDVAGAKKWIADEVAAKRLAVVTSDAPSAPKPVVARQEPQAVEAAKAAEQTRPESRAK